MTLLPSHFRRNIAAFIFYSISMHAHRHGKRPWDQGVRAFPISFVFLAFVFFSCFLKKQKQKDLTQKITVDISLRCFFEKQITQNTSLIA
jgi:hypothetical protein